jgi:ATP-dependent DNA helicase RecG
LAIRHSVGRKPDYPPRVLDTDAYMQQAPATHHRPDLRKPWHSRLLEELLERSSMSAPRPAPATAEVSSYLQGFRVSHMTANEVDAALARPQHEVGGALLGVREDQWFERKGAQIAAKDLAPVLVAFANAEGGTIVVGLGDGRVQGLNAAAGKLNAYRQAPIDHTTPAVRASFAQVSCVNEKGETDTLLVIRVDPGERVHELQNSECYLRVGDESRKLTFSQRQELEFDKGQSVYDGQPAAGVSLSHLDGHLLSQYKKRIGASSNIKGVLQARSLLTLSEEVTNAGYLLFGSHPQILYPQAYVRILRFLGTERGTGNRLGLDEGGDIRVEGPLPRIVQEASRVIENLIPKRRSLRGTGTFEAVPIVPKDAWLEGLVNAVIHRSYSLTGDHIRVEIYTNRVEIESPGRFPGLANPANPLEISRFARNPRIARVCADLRIGQELGEGIRRIFDEMRRVGLTDPVYKQSSGSVKLTLAALPRLDRRVAARLPRGSQRVLDTMRGAETPLGTGQLAELLDLSRPAILTRLRALERERLVKWVGKSQKDPRAVWVLSDA